MVARYMLNAFLSLVCLSLASCTSQIPVATNYPYSEQQKMQAAHHLNVLAIEVVEELKRNTDISKHTPMAVRPKFFIGGDQSNSLTMLQNTSNTTSNNKYTDTWITKSPLNVMFESEWLTSVQFKRAYQNYLTKHLIDAGYNVLDSQTQAELLMVFDIQLVKHHDKPQVRSPHIISQLGRIIAGALDGAYAGVEPEKYEAVITTSIKKDHSYIMSHIGTYYINTPHTPPLRWTAMPVTSPIP